MSPKEYLVVVACAAVDSFGGEKPNCVISETASYAGCTGLLAKCSQHINKKRNMGNQLGEYRRNASAALSKI